MRDKEKKYYEDPKPKLKPLRAIKSFEGGNIVEEIMQSPKKPMAWHHTFGLPNLEVVKNYYKQVHDEPMSSTSTIKSSSKFNSSSRKIDNKSF